MLAFDTNGAGGFRAGTSTGEHVIPGKVTSYEITSALRTASGYEHLLHMMIGRLEARGAGRALIEATMGQVDAAALPGTHPARGI